MSWQESPGQGKVDIIIVRENTEGLYSGRERVVEGGAIAERVITRRASLRIAKKALSLAKSQKRRKITHSTQGKCPTSYRWTFSNLRPRYSQRIC